MEPVKKDEKQNQQSFEGDCKKVNAQLVKELDDKKKKAASTAQTIKK